MSTKGSAIGVCAIKPHHNIFIDRKLRLEFNLPTLRNGSSTVNCKSLAACGRMANACIKLGSNWRSRASRNTGSEVYCHRFSVAYRQIERTSDRTRSTIIATWWTVLTGSHLPYNSVRNTSLDYIGLPVHSVAPLADVLTSTRAIRRALIIDRGGRTTRALAQWHGSGKCRCDQRNDNNDENGTVLEHLRHDVQYTACPMSF